MNKFTTVNTNVYPTFSTKLVKTWADWIREFEPFDWYSTHTFKDDRVHPDFAKRQLRRWIRGINEDLFGRRYREKGAGIYYFMTTEFQKRGSIHFHLLLGGGLWKLLQLKYKERWQSQHPANGWARIEPYERSKGAVYYLGKYISKDGDIEPFFPKWLVDKINNKSLSLPLGDRLIPPLGLVSGACGLTSSD